MSKKITTETTNTKASEQAADEEVDESKLISPIEGFTDIKEDEVEEESEKKDDSGEASKGEAAEAEGESAQDEGDKKDDEVEVFQYGKKKFDSQEAMLAYIREQNEESGKKTGKAETESSSTVTSGHPMAGEEPSKNDLSPEDKDILARLLVNPNEVVEDLSKKVLDEIDRRAENRKRTTETWEGFYKANPDLSRHKNVVEMVRQQIVAENVQAKKQVSWAEGSTELARRTRNLVKQIREDSLEREDIDTKSETAVLSSSGNPAPSRVTKPVAKSGFADQVRAFQAGKRGPAA